MMRATELNYKANFFLKLIFKSSLCTKDYYKSELYMTEAN